jgi:hypothetical protein
MVVSNRRKITRATWSLLSTRMIFRHSQAGAEGSTSICANASVFIAAWKLMSGVKTGAVKWLHSPIVSIKKR